MSPFFARRCNKLEPLVNFEGGKHTCKAQLVSHNERRRSTRQEPAAGGPGGAGSPAPRQARRAAVAAALRGSRWDTSNRAAYGGAAGPTLSLPVPSTCREASPQAVSPLQVALEDGLFDLGDWLAEELGADDTSGSDSGCTSTSPGAQPAAATAAFAAAWPEAQRTAGAAAMGVSTPPPASAEPQAADKADKSSEGTEEGSGNGSTRAGAAPDAHGYALFMAGAAAATAAVAAELRSRTVHVKLPHEGADAAASASPSGTEASPPAQLQPLPASLAHLFMDPASGAADASFIELLAVAVRPGCVLLTLDATLAAQSYDAGEAAAEELLRRAGVRRSPGGSLLFEQGAQRRNVFSHACCS
jgi:hypothetical protein